MDEPRGSWGSHVSPESLRERRTWGPDRSQWLGMLQNQTNVEETLITQLASLTVAGCSEVFTGVITHPIPPADSQLLAPQVLPATSSLPQVPGREQMLYVARCCLPDLCLGRGTVRRPQGAVLSQERAYRPLDSSLSPRPVKRGPEEGLIWGLT